MMLNTSATYRRNNRGPMTEPCRTPNKSAITSDRPPPNEYYIGDDSKLEMYVSAMEKRFLFLKGGSSVYFDNMVVQYYSLYYCDWCFGVCRASKRQSATSTKKWWAVYILISIVFAFVIGLFSSVIATANLVVILPSHLCWFSFCYVLMCLSVCRILVLQSSGILSEGSWTIIQLDTGCVIVWLP